VEPLIYFNSKLTHSGITSYKVFEHCNRRSHKNSLRNLLNQVTRNSDELNYLVNLFRNSLNNDERSRCNDLAVDNLTNSDYDQFLRATFQARHLNPAQSRKIKSLCSKLSYYSASREFTSKKSGKYRFKVAFLTLTAPESTEPSQFLEAFNHFLDYLRRTANCVFVWKKELGELNEKLHVHILVNNFIPYYIVEWKWKRLLIAEGVEWPVNEQGQPTTSHYRIEVPKSKKQIAHYVAKYMSKAYDLPRIFGYISGHSKVLADCHEVNIIEGDLPWDELDRIMSKSKVIRGQYVSHVCCDLLQVKAIAPKIGALFEEQYLRFTQILTLPQKFYEC